MNVKEKISGFMMDKFFSDMKPEEKQKMMEEMMEKFFSTMTPEEKQSMMQSMMPKMMGSMMGGGSGSPMMNMMSTMMGGKGPRDMMKSMMGESKSSGEEAETPWDMCKKMMSTMGKTSELATFATPEVRELFEEWATQIEEEILAYAQESNVYDTAKIAEHFKLTPNSVTFFLTRLAKKGKINLRAQKAD